MVHARPPLLALVALALLAPALARGDMCRNVASSGLAFGVYDVAATAATTATGTITYDCTPPATPRITLSGGTSGSPLARRFAGPDPLAYNVYLDGAFTTVFGDGVSGAAIPAGGNGKGVSITVYGRIPPLQSVAPGAYTDTLTITLQF